MSDDLLDFNDFEIIGKNAEKSETVTRPSVGYWQDAGRRLKKNKVAMLALVIICLYVVLALLGPLMVPYKYNILLERHNS